MKSESLALAACLLAAGCATAVSASQFRFVEGLGYTDLLDGSMPVYRHMTAWDPGKHVETYKVFHHVYGFHGEGFLTKGAGGVYTHHRGLFLGWYKTSTAGTEMDSWHCTKGASLRHVRYLPERELAGEQARRASVTEWTLADNSVLVRDTREVTAWFPAPGKLFLDWTITIASATGHPLSLSGDANHAGFQFRANSTIIGIKYSGPADKPLILRFRTLVLDTDRHGSPTQAQTQAFYNEYLTSSPA